MAPKNKDEAEAPARDETLVDLGEAAIGMEPTTRQGGGELTKVEATPYRPEVSDLAPQTQAHLAGEASLTEAQRKDLKLGPQGVITEPLVKDAAGGQTANGTLYSDMPAEGLAGTTFSDQRVDLPVEEQTDDPVKDGRVSIVTPHAAAFGKTGQPHSVQGTPSSEPEVASDTKAEGVQMAVTHPAPEAETVASDEKAAE